MRLCPFRDCGLTIPLGNFACPRHLASMGDDLHREVHEAHREYLAGRISAAEAQARRRSVIERAQEGRREVST